MNGDLLNGGRKRMPVPRLLLLTLTLLAGACNFRESNSALPTPNDENIIYVTATPMPIVAQAEPTTEPTDILPTVTPTPPIDPAQLLQLGDDFVRNGYLEDAAGVYRTLLDYGDSIEARYRALAAFRWGQVALRAGYFQQALDAFNVLIEQFPDDANSAQAYFLRGDARLGLSLWAAAITDLQRYLTLRPGLIDSYVFERIADARIALGQTESALENYEMAINAKRSLVPLLKMREKLAQIYINLGRAAEAVAQYDAILAVARNVPYRASIAFTAAEAALEGADEATGIARMKAVFESYPTTATAWFALEALSQHGLSYDGFQRGRAAIIAGAWQAAIDAFNQYAATHLQEDISAELYLSLGRAYRQIGNSDAATIAFQKVIDDNPGDPLFGDALLERGRTRFLAGDNPAAIQFYLAIADDYPQLAEGSRRSVMARRVSLRHERRNGAFTTSIHAAG